MTIRATLVKETNNAKLIRWNGRDIWMPRSQISSFVKFKPKDDGAIECEATIPSWLAAVKGIEE